jgi:hypothetical protein
MESTELRQLLHERAAAESFEPIDPERILTRARARRRRQHTSAAALLAVLTAGGVFAALLTGSGQGSGMPDQVIPAASSPGRTPAQTPSAAELVTAFPPATLAPLPAGWIAAPGAPPIQGDATGTRVGTHIAYWGGAVGPDDNRSYSKSGVIFDVPGRSWSTMTPSPLAARAEPATTGNDQLLFIWGGYADEQRYLDDGAVYDVTTKAWTKIARSPLAAQPTLGAVWNGTEFVVVTAVPRGPQHTTSLAAAYNPVTNSWRRLPDLPSGLTSANVMFVSGRIVVLGAIQDTNNLGSNVGYALEPGAISWHLFASPPIEPQTITATTDGTLMYAVGGAGARPGPYDVPLNFYRFSFAAGVWDARPAPPVREVECYPYLAMSTTKVFLTYCSGNAFFDRPGQYWTAAPGLGIGRPIAVGSELVFLDAGRTVIYIGG